MVWVLCVMLFILLDTLVDTPGERTDMRRYSIRPDHLSGFETENEIEAV